jgi:hypothetical protein
LGRKREQSLIEEASLELAHRRTGCQDGQGEYARRGETRSRREAGEPRRRRGRRLHGARSRDPGSGRTRGPDTP